jgi:hypothetical protein
MYSLYVHVSPRELPDLLRWLRADPSGDVSETRRPRSRYSYLTVDAPQEACIRTLMVKLEFYDGGGVCLVEGLL